MQWILRKWHTCSHKVHITVKDRLRTGLCSFVFFSCLVVFSPEAKSIFLQNYTGQPGLKPALHWERASGKMGSRHVLTHNSVCKWKNPMWGMQKIQFARVEAPQIFFFWGGGGLYTWTPFFLFSLLIKHRYAGKIFPGHRKWFTSQTDSYVSIQIQTKSILFQSSSWVGGLSKLRLKCMQSGSNFLHSWFSHTNFTGKHFLLKMCSISSKYLTKFKIC